MQPGLIGYGGVQKYGMDVARALASEYEIEVVCGHPVDKDNLGRLFGADFSGIRFRHDARCRSSLGLPRTERKHVAKGYTQLTAEYSCVVSNDFRLPDVCGSRGGILLNHSAATNLRLRPSFPRDWPILCWLTEEGRTQRDIRERIFSWRQVVTNSRFTQEWLRRFWHRDSTVIYPAVEPLDRQPLPRQNWIVSCGFFKGVRNSDGRLACSFKRQDVLLQAFRDFCQRETVPWELHLVGHIDLADENSVELLDRLKKDAAGLPVIFHLNLPHQQLREELFGAAKLYWQASGFERDVEVDPSWAESFGMATVEAMAEGVVPLAYKEAGPLEILDFDQSLLWRTTDELLQQSRNLHQSEHRWRLLSERCRARAADFSRDRFLRSWLQVIEAVLRRI